MNNSKYQDSFNFKSNNDFNITLQYHLDEQLGAMNDIFVSGTLAYVAAHWGGLLIFNISNFEEPILIGQFYDSIDSFTTSIADRTSGIYVKDNYAFLADGLSGLVILNVSNPYNPQKIAHYSQNEEYYEVFVDNQFVYLLKNADTIIILDISIITEPTFISNTRFFAYQFSDLSVSDNLLYLWGYTGFMVVNATDPMNLSELNFIHTIKVCSINQNFLYCADTSNRLLIYNVSQYTLFLLTNYTVQIDGDIKYLSTNNENLFIGSTEEIIMLNITDKEDPALQGFVKNLNSNYEKNSIWIKRKLGVFNDTNKDILIVADYQKGLILYNLSIESSTQLGYYSCGFRTELIKSLGNLIFVVSRPEQPIYPSRIEIYEIRRNKVDLYGYCDSEWAIVDFYVNNEILIYANTEGIEILDISKEGNIETINSYYPESISTIRGFLYDDRNHAIYICSDISGLLILDVENFNQISLISQLTSILGFPIRAYDVEIYDEYLIIADNQMFGGFGIINIDDVFDPHEIYYKPLNIPIKELSVMNTVLCILTENNVLNLYNLSFIDLPVLIKKYDNYNSIETFYIEDSYIFILDYYNLTILDICDINNPQKLIEITSSSPESIFKDVYINNDMLFLTASWDGFYVWSFPYQNDYSVILRYFLIYFSVLYSINICIILVIYIRKKKFS